MRTTKTTLFVASSGANARCLIASRHRVRLEFHYGNTASSVFLSDSPMTAASQGVILSSSFLTKVFTKEAHGDLVTRDWFVWGTAANAFIIVETFENENV